MMSRFQQIFLNNCDNSNYSDINMQTIIKRMVSDSI